MPYAVIMNDRGARCGTQRSPSVLPVLFAVQAFHNTQDVHATRMLS